MGVLSNFLDWNYAETHLAVRQTGRLQPELPVA